MKCKDVISVLERIAPEELAEDWDNIGLLCGRRERNVSRVMVTLDVTEEVVEQAVARQVDMLVSHHPLIFHGVRQITTDDAEGRKLLKLIQNDISYYTMHTNFDLAQRGMAAVVAKQLGLQELTLLRNECEITTDGKTEAYGAGRIGTLAQPVTVAAFAEEVKRSFKLQGIRLSGSRPADQLVTRVAVVPGSGEDYIEDALTAGAEVYLTGDVRHHKALDAAEAGLTILDCGHYGLEQIFTPYMEQYLSNQLSSNIEVISVDSGDPFLWI